MRWLVGLGLIAAFVIYQGVAKMQQQAQQMEEEAKQAQEALPPPPPPPPPTEPTIQERLNEQTIQTVRQLMMDPNPRVKLAAIDLLYNLNDPEAMKMLKELLKVEQDPDVIRGMLRLVSSKREEKGLPLAINALKHHLLDVRMEAINIVESYGAEETIIPLTALMKDQEEQVKLRAIEAVKNVQHQVEERRRREEEERRAREAEELRRRLEMEAQQKNK